MISKPVLGVAKSLYVMRSCRTIVKVDLEFVEIKTITEFLKAPRGLPQRMDKLRVRLLENVDDQKPAVGIQRHRCPKGKKEVDCRNQKH